MRAVVIIAAMLVVSPITLTAQEQSYDEWAESPTVYVEGCGTFPAVRVVVDGQETEARGLIRNGRTFLPAREVLERLGADVRWVQNERSFYASLPERNRTVRVTVGSPEVRVFRYDAGSQNWSGEFIQTLRLNVSPFQCEGRVFAPVRSAVEAAGGTVRYDARTRTVSISAPARS